jgi:hypothetical protein
MALIGNPLIQSAFVYDTFSGNGSTTAFTMSVAPANTASVIVAITGVVQDPSTYSVSGTTLTFTGAPPSGTGNISARYLGIPASGVTTTAYRTVTTFTATAGQTTFTPPSYTVGFINVYQNGSRLTSTSDYTATNGTTVVLVAAASVSDVIVVESFLVSSVLNAIPATAGSVGSTYLASSLTLTTPTLTSPTLSSPTVSSGGLTLSSSGLVFSDTSTQTSTSLGYLPQSWQSVTRASGTTYTNSTGRPIQLFIMAYSTPGAVQITVAGTVFPSSTMGSGTQTSQSVVIPIGATYSISGSFNAMELR